MDTVVALKLGNSSTHQVTMLNREDSTLFHIRYYLSGLKVGTFSVGANDYAAFVPLTFKFHYDTTHELNCASRDNYNRRGIAYRSRYVFKKI